MGLLVSRMLTYDVCQRMLTYAHVYRESFGKFGTQCVWDFLRRV
jgi:hypothetical protein